MRPAAADAEGGRGGTRPRMLPALVRREVAPGTALLVVGAAASAAAAAYEVHGPGGGVALPLIDRVLRRFDLTILATSAMLLMLRSAANIEADHRDGWLPPVLTCGGSRWRYGAALLITAIMVPAAMFLTVAVTFAAAVGVLTSSDELLRALPRTLAGGLLLLGTWATCAVAVGIVTRRASVTAGVIALIVAAPSFLLMRFAFHEAPAPLWTLMIQLLSPLLFIPTDSPNTVRAILYTGTVAGMAMLLSFRYAGRSR